MFKTMVTQSEIRFNVLEEIIYKFVCSIGRMLMKTALQRIDKQLYDRRPEGLVSKMKVKMTVLTRMGTVTLSRRYYEEKGSGRKRYLLDEYLGIDGKERISGGIKEQILKLAAKQSYRDTAESISRMLPEGSISHTTVQNYIKKAGDNKVSQEKVEPSKPGDIDARILFTEADGVYISLQRDKQDKLEIKAGVAYTGWEPRYMASDEHKLINKMAYVSTGNGKEFWEGMDRELRRRYAVGDTEISVLNSDGAGWIKEGLNWLYGDVVYQLDRYHINKAVTAVLNYDHNIRRKVLKKIYEGEIKEVKELLLAEINAGRGNLDMMRALYRYISNNREGLKDYRKRKLNLPEGKECRGLGAMEGSISGMIAMRMKGNRTSWSRSGALAMAKVLQMNHTGELEEFLRKRPIHTLVERFEESLEPVTQEIKRIKKRVRKVWDINIDLPVLSSGKDWAKGIRQMLKCKLENLL